MSVPLYYTFLKNTDFILCTLYILFAFSYSKMVKLFLSLPGLLLKKYKLVDLNNSNLLTQSLESVIFW